MQTQTLSRPAGQSERKEAQILSEMLNHLMDQMALLHEMSAKCDDAQDLCELSRALAAVGSVAIEASRMDAPGYVPASRLSSEDTAS